MRIGVDAGGTFTDFVVLHDDGRLLETFKLRSNKADPAKVILDGLDDGARGRKRRRGRSPRSHSSPPTRCWSARRAHGLRDHRRL